MADGTVIEVATPIAFDLARTLRPLRSALSPGQTLFAPGVVAVASRTPTGIGTIRMAQRDGRVAAEAWGDGAEWLLERLADLLGFDDDLEGFSPQHPLLHDVYRRSQGVRWGKTERVMEVLVPTIVGQKVTGKGASRSMRALIRAHGETAPGPGDLRVLPEPSVLANLPYYEYHKFDIEKKRADTIRRVAARADRIERITSEPLVEGYRLLHAFRGVGVWSSALVVGTAMGDADAVPVGDYHLPNMVAWALAGEERADDARMLELLEPYVGHRGRVIRLIKSAGIKAPAYGPRNSVRSIRNQ